MNKNAIIGLVALVVVVGGGAWYFSSKGTPNTIGGTESGNAMTAKQNSSGSGTFAELMGMGGSQKCTITMNVENAPTQATVYVSNGQVRSDVAMTVQGKQISAHMIQKDKMMYSWSDAAAQGMKMEIPTGANASADVSSQSGFDMNSKVDYSCSPWVADGAQFTPPASVQFMDLNAMMPKGMPTGAGAGANMMIPN